MSKFIRVLGVCIGALLIGMGAISTNHDLTKPDIAFADNTTTDPHSNDSITNPVNWNDWQKNPQVRYALDSSSKQNGTTYEASRGMSYSWDSAGDTIASLNLKKPYQITFNRFPTTDFNDFKIWDLSVNGVSIPDNQISITADQNNASTIRSTFSLPSGIPQTMSSDSPDQSLRVTLKYKAPYRNGAGPSREFLAVATVPQVIRIFYKDAKTGKDLKQPITLGTGMKIDAAIKDPIVAPHINGYTLKTQDSIQHLTAEVDPQLKLKTIRDYIESVQSGLPAAQYEEIAKSEAQFFQDVVGGIPLRDSIFGYVNNRDNEGNPFNVDIYKMLATKTSQFKNGNSVTGLSLSTVPQAIVFWYDQNTTPQPAPNPTTPNSSPQAQLAPTPTPKSNGDDKAANDNPTTNENPVTDAKNANETVLATDAVEKGSVVYATKKIYLYQQRTFKKSQRIATYLKQKRVSRPMFVVTGYAHSKGGALRYKVRDVNHHSKTAGKKGYITANRKYVVNAYYKTMPKNKRITVINPKGVHVYKNQNLTKQAKTYKKGSHLRVKKLVKHNLTTRYQLTNGYYVTANKKLVIQGDY